MDTDQTNMLPPQKPFYPVLHVDTGKTWGGGQQQVLYLHRGLLERGVPSILLCHRGSPLAERAAAESIPGLQLGMRPPFAAVTAVRIAKLIRLQQVRTLHMHTSHAHSLGLLAAHFVRRKVHKVVSRRVAFLRNPNPFNRRKYRHGEVRYIAISNAVRQRLVQLGVPDEHISVVYSGIDPDRFSRIDAARARQIAQELHITPGSFVVGTVGSLVPCKGHAVLIEAMADVARVIPRIFCVIVGEGPLRARLESLIRRKRLQQIVALPGQRKEVPEFLSLMNLFVMPSLQEGLGVALLEAMAAGRPVIASDAGGIPEVVADSQTGLLVPPAQPKALAESMIALIRDPTLMSAFASNARRRTRERFSCESMVEGTLDVYRSLA